MTEQKQTPEASCSTQKACCCGSTSCCICDKIKAFFARLFGGKKSS